MTNQRYGLYHLPRDMSLLVFPVAVLFGWQLYLLLGVPAFGRSDVSQHI